LHIDGGLTWFLQATTGASNDTSALTYTFDLSLQSQVSEHGTINVALEAGDGEGIDPSIGALSATNYDAFYSELTSAVAGSTNVVAPSISQAYYEGVYMDDRLVVNIGKLDIHSLFDDNAYANDETDQFMSAIFTRSADTTYAQLDYYYAPGLALQYTISDWLDVALIEANGNDAGFNEVFKKLYSVGQITFKPTINGLGGNYRFYLIEDHRNSTNTTFTDITTSRTTNNQAWGVSVDQALPGHAGVFARYSTQDDGILENTVTSSWSLGAVIEGATWDREADAVGIGYGRLKLNSDPAAVSAAGISNPDDETHVEVFYKLGVNDHLTLTADIQMVSNIGGEANADTVTIGGLRGQVNF